MEKKEKKYKSQSFLKTMTVGLILQYKQCSDKFLYNNDSNPRRLLTIPEDPLEENSNDNIEGNLIMFVNDVIDDRYFCKD
jgi:hypothetical protein